MTHTFHPDFVSCLSKHIHVHVFINRKPNIIPFPKLFHCALTKIENEFFSILKIEFCTSNSTKYFQFDICIYIHSGNGWKRTVVYNFSAKNRYEKGTGNRQNGIKFSEQISCDTR